MVFDLQELSVLKETMLPMHGKKFYQQFEWYLYAIKADNEPDMRKISLFLNCCRTRSSRSIWNIYLWNWWITQNVRGCDEQMYWLLYAQEESSVWEVLCLIHVNRIKNRQLTVMSPSCVRKLKAVNMMNLKIHSLETGLCWEQIQQRYKRRCYKIRI